MSPEIPPTSTVVGWITRQSSHFVSWACIWPETIAVTFWLSGHYCKQRDTPGKKVNHKLRDVVWSLYHGVLITYV